MQFHNPLIMCRLSQIDVPHLIQSRLAMTSGRTVMVLNCLCSKFNLGLDALFLVIGRRVSKLSTKRDHSLRNTKAVTVRKKHSGF